MGILPAVLCAYRDGPNNKLISVRASGREEVPPIAKNKPKQVVLHTAARREPAQDSISELYVRFLKRKLAEEHLTGVQASAVLDGILDALQHL